MATPPTIYDVAGVAGVSASTVSRTFSRPGRVSARTAARVRAAALELGYGAAPGSTAPVRRTGLIAVMVSDLTNPVFHGIVRGAQDEASAHGRTVVVFDARESAAAERRALPTLLAAVESVLLASSRTTDSAIRVIAKQRPVVVLNRVVPEVPSLVSDQELGVRFALEHLAALGHREVTYVAGPEASWADGVRWRSTIEEGPRRGLKVRRVGPVVPTGGGGRAALAAFREAPTSAVLAFNDLVAAGFAQAVIDSGGTVPGDVSIVGFDDVRSADGGGLALTTVAAPLRDLGAHGIRALVRAVETDRPAALRAVPLPTRLVVRDSTAQSRRNRTSPAWWTTSVSGSAS